MTKWAKVVDLIPDYCMNQNLCETDVFFREYRPFASLILFASVLYNVRCIVRLKDEKAAGY